MPQFFIDRPVFAWVVALFILLAGALAIPQLPVAQYPNVAPPQVSPSLGITRRVIGRCGGGSSGRVNS